MTLRIGIDIGGTFTDLVAIAADGRVPTHKTASTPHDYAEGIVDGLRALLDDAECPEVLHATTIGSNTILEGKGARTALITTRGFRDTLDIRDLRMPRLYDIAWQKPPPLVERRLRLEVIEKTRPDGTIAVPLDAASVAAAIATLRAEGVAASRCVCCTAMPTRRMNRMSRARFGRRCPTSLCPSATRYCRRSRSIRAPARRSSTLTSSRSCALI